MRGDRNTLERLNGVWNAVFEELKLVAAQIRHGLSVTRGLEVYADGLRARAERGLLPAGRLVLRREDRGDTGGEQRGEGPGSRQHCPYYSIDLTIYSTTFLASPNTIIVLSK